MKAAPIALVLGGALAGLALGWQLWRPPAPVVERYAPAERQADSSLVLERKPDPTARPAHRIPEGAVVERVATVVVQPTSRVAVIPEGANRPADPKYPHPTETSTAVDSSTPASCTCDSVIVDLSLVRLEDGSRRVIASARGGTVVGGVDVPVESAAPPRVLRWAAGPEYDLVARRWGGFIDYAVDELALVRLPASVGLSVTPNDRGVRVGLRFGVRW